MRQPEPVPVPGPAGPVRGVLGPVPGTGTRRAAWRGDAASGETASGEGGGAAGDALPPGPFGLLVDCVRDGGVVVLSGAGLSTESGIPDYRGPTGRARRAEPMTYQAFVGGAAARQRYWARSHLGWRHVARAAPNAGHRAVAGLQRRGLLAGIITQNVDGLHQAAGARQVIELHGSLDRVLCLTCGQRTARDELDERLRAANPGWAAEITAINPDGDAVLADEAAGAVPRGGLPGVRRPAQAGRGVLRRERAADPGR